MEAGGSIPMAVDVGQAWTAPTSAVANPPPAGIRPQIRGVDGLVD